MDPISLALKFGPAVLRGVTNLFSGQKEKKIVNTVADIISASNGNPQKASSQIESLPPADLLEFKKFVTAHETDMRELDAKILETINQTMRTESQSEKWWVSGWRPFFGFVTAISFFISVICIFVLAGWAIYTRNAAVLALIPQLISQLVLLFGIPGVFLGITTHHRGKEKIAKLKLKTGG